MTEVKPTYAERIAIKQLVKAVCNLPPTLKLYCLDGSLVICKTNTPATKFCETVVYEGVRVANTLQDIHDGSKLKPFYYPDTPKK